MGSHESLDEGQDAVRVLRNGPKNEDAGMAAWRVAPQVTDPAVEGEQEPALIRCCCHDHRIALAGELLVSDRVDVMALATKRCGQFVRQVLVELGSHAGSGWISSRASAAP